MGILNIFQRKKVEEGKKTGNEARKHDDAPVIRRAEKQEEKKSEKRIQRKKTDLASRILIHPLVTEKAATLGDHGKYVFIVVRHATRAGVRQAIEACYGVHPRSVHLLSLHGKKTRSGRTRGNTNVWKKAIVTLKAGEKIQVYEGV